MDRENENSFMPPPHTSITEAISIMDALSRSFKRSRDADTSLRSIRSRGASTIKYSFWLLVSGITTRRVRRNFKRGEVGTDGEFPLPNICNSATWNDYFGISRANFGNWCCSLHTTPLTHFAIDTSWINQRKSLVSGVKWKAKRSKAFFDCEVISDASDANSAVPGMIHRLFRQWKREKKWSD